MKKYWTIERRQNFKAQLFLITLESARRDAIVVRSSESARPINFIASVVLQWSLNERIEPLL
jgi:hypothetical protein